MKLKWRSLGLALENQPVYYKEANLWDHLDAPCEGTVRLPHPHHRNQVDVWPVHRFEVGGEQITFAVMELSAGLYGFYVAV